MGLDKTNVFAIAHRPDGGPTGRLLRVHQANISLDATTADEATPAEWATITAGAAQSQSAFDSAVSAVWPAWYAARTTAQKAAIRDCVQSL